MIRFILKRDFRDAIGGCEGSHFITVDVDLPELEVWLRGGGSGPSGYEITSLVGAELRDAKEPTP